MTRSYTEQQTLVVHDRFFWPDPQVNAWCGLMLVCGVVILSMFANLIVVQKQLGLPLPWVFTFGVTTGGVSVIAVIFVALLIAQKRMIPGLMMMIAFALFVLYMTGLVETGIQLFGPGTISNNCQRYVQHSKVTGLSVDTLAWLSQNDLCNEWYTLFVFWFVGAMLGPWMLIMAMQVATGGFEKR